MIKWNSVFLGTTMIRRVEPQAELRKALLKFKWYTALHFTCNILPSHGANACCLRAIFTLQYNNKWRLIPLKNFVGTTFVFLQSWNGSTTDYISHQINTLRELRQEIKTNAPYLFQLVGNVSTFLFQFSREQLKVSFLSKKTKKWSMFTSSRANWACVQF